MECGDVSPLSGYDECSFIFYSVGETIQCGVCTSRMRRLHTPHWIASLRSASLAPRNDGGGWMALRAIPLRRTLSAVIASQRAARRRSNPVENTAERFGAKRHPPSAVIASQRVARRRSNPVEKYGGAVRREAPFTLRRHCEPARSALAKQSSAAYAHPACKNCIRRTVIARNEAIQCNNALRSLLAMTAEGGG